MPSAQYQWGSCCCSLLWASSMEKTEGLLMMECEMWNRAIPMVSGDRFQIVGDRATAGGSRILTGGGGLFEHPQQRGGVVITPASFQYALQLLVYHLHGRH